MNSIPLPAGTIALLTLAAAAAAQGITGQHHEVVMAVGSPVAAIPGATINATSNFDAPVIDQNGTMLFRARMLGGGVAATDDRAYFMGRGSGDLQMILRAGDQAPGLPAGTLLRSTSSTGLNSTPRISPFGELLFFQSALADPNNPIPTTADSALFWGPVGGFMLLAREGDQVPFLASGITWGALSQSNQFSHINNAGQVLFSAPLVGATTTTDSVMVIGAPGGLDAVVQEGQTMPGGEVVIPVSGTTLSFTTLINAVGQVLFDTRYQVAGSVTALNDRALVLYNGPGSYTTIIREGDQAPGLPAGVVFKDSAAFNGWAPGVGSTCFNVNGQALIQARVEEGGTTIGTDEQTLWVGSTSGLTLVFRRNDPCPGLPAGVNFGVPNSSGAAINDNGTLCFITSVQGAAVTTADDSSYWYGTPGNLMLLAREGDVVPGLAPSGNGPWRYGPINAGTGSPHLNGRGQVLFQNTLSDGVAMRNVLMSYDSILGIQLQLDSTDTFTTPNGTAAWTGLSNSGSTSSDGGSAWFNSQGDFLWKPLFNAPLTAAIAHGRVGSLQSSSYSISQSIGGQQNFSFDFGTARAGQIYALIGSASGTRPGTLSPIGPQTIPLNWDAWTDITLAFHNSLVYVNTIGFLDGNGRGTSTFFVPGGYTWDPTLHHAVVSLTVDGFGTPTSTSVSDPIAVRLY
jgi:hypothetical protein